MAIPVLPMPDFAANPTHVLVGNGLWSDPSVWQDATLPGDDAVVMVEGQATYDLADSPRLAVIGVIGSLDVMKGADTELKAGTLQVMGGAYMAGSCKSNVPLRGSHTVTWLDRPLDPVNDPGQYGSGLLVAGGNLDLCGDLEKLHGCPIMGLNAGTVQFTLDVDPVGWEVDNYLFFASCVPNCADYRTPQDDVVKVTMISGRTVSFSPALKWNHQPPAGKSAYVVNLSRRITFQSENSSGVRGHAMFMKMGIMAPMVDLCHVTFKDMGRSDAMTPLTDPQLDAEGLLIPGSAANPRGRYAVHAHRCGPVVGAMQTWDNLVAWGGKKVGFNIHDSYVEADDLVSVQCQGSCLYTERGSEIGHYNGCFGFRTSGSGKGVEERINQSDFGHDGYGLWLQGPGVTAARNVYGSHRIAAARIYCRGVDPKGLGVIATTYNGQPIQRSSYLGWQDNAAVCCPVGHSYNWIDSAIAGPSVGTRLSSWGCTNGGEMFYALNVAFVDPDFLGPNYAPQSAGVAINTGYSHDFAAKGSSICGFEVGTVMPGVGHSAVDGGQYGNVYDIDIRKDGKPEAVGAVVEIINEPTFLGVPPAVLAGRVRVNYRLPNLLDGLWAGPNEQPPPPVFWPASWLLPDGQQLYSVQQAEDYVPFPTVPMHGTKAYPAFPTVLIGLTNAQLRDQFGLCPGGMLAPMGSRPDPRTNGLIGPRAVVPGVLFLRSPQTPASLLNYRLQWGQPYPAPATTDPGGQITLTTGWNVLPRLINGLLYSFFVRGPAS